MGAGPSMEDHLFNLRFTAQSLNREAKKCEKNAASNKLKCKKAMEQGNMEGARIFAESAIRDKNTSLNYLRLSSRIDAVAQRVNTAVKMQTLTKDMSGIVKSMDAVMKTMDVEKITAVMEKFESQFENLDLATGVMEQSMVSSTAQSMPESQVEGLMKEVADEHGLEVQFGISQLPSGTGKLGGGLVQQTQKQQERNVLLAGAAAGGAPAGGNKPGGGADGSAAAGSGGGGGMSAGGAAPAAASGGAGGGNALDEESLEERLRRLQQ